MDCTVWPAAQVLNVCAVWGMAHGVWRGVCSVGYGAWGMAWCVQMFVICVSVCATACIHIVCVVCVYLDEIIIFTV